MRRSLPLSLRLLSQGSHRFNFQPHRACGARWGSTVEPSTGHIWSTPLAKQLAEAITTTGPIPVASFMRQCLTSDLGGYYTSTAPSDKDQFGAKGDFVTSPEISQIFGELIGVWVVAEWIAQGRKSNGIYLMEMGPGRGTLMDDMLRTIRNFPTLAKAIEAVYLVESDPNLRRAQHKLLCCENELKETDFGHESISKHSNELKIVWAEDVRLVPLDPRGTPFIVAHEFFDALPINIFQSVPPSPQHDNTIQTPTGPIPGQRRIPKENQWRELVVSPKPPHRLKEFEPEFELALSKGATPLSTYLPETSARYRALKSTNDATIEISPESQAYAKDFAVRIGGSNIDTLPPVPPPTSVTSTSTPSGTTDEALPKLEPSGAALIVDYGPPSSIPVNSLRGIRKHTRVSPFTSPGTTDISVDVDFLALAESAIAASPSVEVHGPVDQARFLTAMRIEERAAQLVKRAVDKETSGSSRQEKGELTEMVKRIEGGWKRLVDVSPQGMGRLYQVMAILPFKPSEDGNARRRPVGFGGDVTL